MSLVVNGLYTKYGDKEVLKDISFSIDKGEILYLLGPNGSGKTTLFKSLLKIISYHRGEVFMDDEPIHDKKTQELSKYFAYIPQYHTPVYDYTVLDMVLMGRASHISSFHSPKKNDVDIALSSLKKMNIENLHDRIYTTLSGGERQMVLIARALAQEASILIMDEPTANLDYGNQAKVLKEMKRLSEEGYSMVISCHNPELASLYATQVMLLYKGEMFKFGKPLDILNRENLSHIYGIEIDVIEIQSKFGYFQYFISNI